jgi:hypothetical protein
MEIYLVKSLSETEFRLSKIGRIKAIDNLTVVRVRVAKNHCQRGFLILKGHLKKQA